jgi:hypothetical protein
MVRARVPNAFILALVATTRFSKSDLSIFQKKKKEFMQGKGQKEILHSSNSTQISSGFPFCL